MGLPEIILIVCGGIVAGVANTIAGAGSLLTYPILIACGLSPLAANVTNDIGVVPGNVSGMVGLRSLLGGQGKLLRAIVPRVVIGSLIGAGILLVAPSSAFGWVAPPLLLLASALTAAQPWLIRRSQERASASQTGLHAAIDATAVYGGYFGTGIGLIYMAAMGAFVDESSTRLNAVKSVLQTVTNGIAGIVFAFVAPVHWEAAASLAAGTVGGGYLGARIAHQIPPALLRKIIACVGVLSALWLMARQLGVA